MALSDATELLILTGNRCLRSDYIVCDTRHRAQKTSPQRPYLPGSSPRALWNCSASSVHCILPHDQYPRYCHVTHWWFRRFDFFDWGSHSCSLFPTPNRCRALYTFRRDQSNIYHRLHAHCGHYCCYFHLRVLRLCNECGAGIPWQSV